MKRLSYNNKISQSQSGVTLLLAILILAAILAISFSLASVLLVEVSSSGDLLRSEASFYGATGVGEQALFDLKRDACPSNGYNCYYSQFSNSVNLNGSPQQVSTSTPIFSDKVLVASTFSNTTNKYDFCGDTATTTGCGYGKVTVNYIVTNSNEDSLYAYVCQWDRNASPGTYESNPPCTQTGQNQGYWIGPSNGNWQSDGSVQLTPSVNSVSWTLNPGLQQELIITNPSGQSTIYFSVATFASDGVTPLGLPYVGKTSVEVNTLNGEVGRHIQVSAPNQ